MKTIKVTAKGQVTLPQALREKLDIEVGTYLDATIFQGGILLRPLKDGNQLIKEYGQKYGTEHEDAIEQARSALAKVPFSVSERSSKLREE